MNPLTVLGGALSGVLNYLRERQQANSIGALSDAVSVILQWIGAGFQGVANSMYQEQGAVEYALQNYSAIGDYIQHAQGSMQATIDHITFTILPNSLGYVVHNIYEGWIVPMTARLNHLDAEAADLYARLGQVWTEVYNSLRPDVNALLAFEDAFKQGDQPSINILNEWIRNPVSMGDFVAPAVANPLANYLNEAAAEGIHKGFAYVMVNVWDDEAAAIWDAVARWLVSDT